MNEDDRRLLDSDLSEAFAELAPLPRPELMAAITRRIEATPQSSEAAALFTGPHRRIWRTVGLGAFGVVAGIAVGLTAASLLVSGPTASTPAGTVPPASASAVVRSPQDTASQSAASAQPSRVAHDPGAAWERIDLPDPVPGVFGGAGPQKVVAFRGDFVLVGSAWASCVSDIHEPPPDCTERLSELTAGFGYQAAVVWTSTDGRSWELIQSEALEGARVTDAATDGERLVVVGEISEQPIELGSDARPEIWTSTDGRAWEVVEQEGPTPEYLEWTANGWIGVRNTRMLEGSAYVAAGPEFLASSDGLRWEVVSEGGALGRGHVADLAVDLAGTTAIAAGYHEMIDEAGGLGSGSAVAWRTQDGRSWERTPDQQSLAFSGPGALYLQSVTATDDGWLGVGRADDAVEAAGVWRSVDGLSWERLTAAPPRFGGYGTIDHVAWTDPGFVATGTIAGAHGSVIAAWVSADGATWEPVHRQPALEDGVSSGVIVEGDLIVAPGSRGSGLDHWFPVVYVTAR